ncbi:MULTISPECIES: heme o synthase [Idiomarina]|jgi:protoheme IX farnesyltransferase|uniref:heme o synthase n=2 Tax=Idiomarinaceae TaxID=267893 RepID=UPI0006C8BDC3|nr:MULTISPECIES: heme o synthase [Idiomarina]KPD20717.1 protoheme IX farnesyltransferase [Idiomarina abyssalis]MAL84221.1 protoheme IX farnesyltransferase [Idiomarina sp.]MAO67863.1 protoheme IX farnesyltransferase [Idiomarina sp.]MBF79605.1 protoheme IX farnesyltransferase [Idiomarina sp.]MDA6067599.1 heme o synthase [Idiomarina abyssalis]|tara:strand:+ start:1333 stop:2229 length:897 start_codon:yes stop_codon:yes gene_type:complete
MESVATKNITKTRNAHWRDYLELTKPRVVALLLLTAVVGMCLATEELVSMNVLVPALAGIGLMSAAAAAINHLVDRHIDAKMARTLRRPLPQGNLSPTKVTVFAATIGAIGFVTLYAWVNPLTAWLTFASMVGYAVVYTMFLKRATPQNIVIGGLAGAAPPLLGWTAVTNEINAPAVLLVMIIFTWTPPHFWALAVHRAKDYARAEIPMLPVTHGIDFTKTCIFLYTVLLTVVCLMPFLIGMTGMIYLVGVSLLNAIFLAYAWKLKYAPSKKTAFNMFAFSIWHLMLLFVILLVDHYV